MQKLYMMYGFLSFKEYRSNFGKVNVFNTTIFERLPWKIEQNNHFMSD